MKKLNDITFIQGQGGSGRVANGTDYISALMFYDDNRPAALLASLPGGVDNYPSGSVVQIFSPSDAVALGIDNTYSDETQSTGKMVISNAGAEGDSIEIKVQDWIGGSGKGLISLGKYTSVGDNIAQFVTGLTAAINAGTNTHGWTAVASLGTTVTWKAPKGKGVYFNTGSPYSKVLVGATAGAITQNVIAGVASKLAVFYYHIVRYFAKKSDGTVYVGIFDEAGSSDFADLANIENFAGGSVVQCGIWDDTQTYALASLTLIQTQIDALKAAFTYLSSVTYAADIKAISTPLATLAGAPYNLATLSAKNVSSLIDNDGNGTGFDLFQQTGKTISSLGAEIGCISESAISEDMGNPIDRFNCDDGAEFDTLMFGDGTMYNLVSRSLLNALNNNRYIYLSKVPYVSGSFYSDNGTAVAYTSDYAYINDNRIIDRVIKDSFAALAPILKSVLKLKTDGTMTPQTIAFLVATEGDVIKPLIASGDLAGDPSNFNATDWVIINPLQKPNVASKLVIQVKLFENAIARSIEVPIGFA